MKELNILTHLYFGYDPTIAGDLFDLFDKSLNLEQRKRLSMIQDEAKLIGLGVDVLRGVFQDMVANIALDKLHVLPLSGGLDSRAILGGLLENLDSKQIHTVTFGTPGTWDYEIGQQVARVAGVQCESLDLTTKDWIWGGTDSLVKTALHIRRSNWLFDAYVNRQIPDRLGDECIYWSGFMGGAIGGSLFPKKPSVTWQQAITRFVSQERFCVSLNLLPPTFDARIYLPVSPTFKGTLMCYEEQLSNLVALDHAQGNFPKGYNYHTPFLHPDWLSFILNIPFLFRKNQRLYKRILQTAYPKLFSLPTKTNYGLSLDASPWRHHYRKTMIRMQAAIKRYIPWLNSGVSPLTNYIDFDRGLREAASLKAVVYENIHDLRKRDIVDWIDVERIWIRHQNQVGNYADALLLLAALEIHLKAAEYHKQIEAC